MTKKNIIHYKNLLLLFLITISIKILIQPSGLTHEAWSLFLIFIATIAGVVFKIMPSGPMCFTAISICLLTKTMSIQACLVKFSYPVCWLIFIAFMIARGFIITGLGSRIALHFVLIFGKSEKGLGTGLAIAELFLAPFIPSNTARGAGIIFPIADALTKEINISSRNNELSNYLMQVCFHANVVSCTLFLTAMAANPMIADYALQNDIHLDWMQWFIGASLPGIIILLLLPHLVAKVVKLKNNYTDDFRSIITEKMNNLGPISKQEIYMIITFIMLFIGWSTKSLTNLDATSVALIGFAFLLVTETLTWNDILTYKSAWNTLVWLAILLAMTSSMSELGVMQWIASGIQILLPKYNPLIILWMLCAINIYIHYIFASLTSHVAALYHIFLPICLSLGAPPLVSAISLGISSSLGASLTHFGTGTAPVYFGTGYCSLAKWWEYGLKISIFTFLAWSIIGPIWWYCIGWL